jgi:hypothetical protein
MGLFRRRFSDLVDRQLDLFAGDHREEIRQLTAALDAHRDASTDEHAEAFGDYQDRVDWAAQDLLTLRDTYARTLDSETAAAYEKAFARGVRRRFPALASAVRSGDVGD